MSPDPVIDALAKIMERLDAIEGRIENPSIPSAAEQYPDWNEDVPTALTLVPEPAPAPAQIHRPGDMKSIPLDPSTQWVPGAAKLPVSDQTVSLGSSSGHTMTPDQIKVAYQREMIAPMRVRPVEDGMG